jgi:hypothetical protein
MLRLQNQTLTQQCLTGHQTTILVGYRILVDFSW